MKKHLAIFSPEVVKLLFSGVKTIETRFSQKRIEPYGAVSVGDLVYIKKSGEDIVGQFKVRKAIYFEGLDHDDWQLIKTNYGPKLSLGSQQLDDNYFKLHQQAKFASIIFIDEIEQFITSPIRIPKKDLRGWVVLN